VKVETSRGEQLMRRREEIRHEHQLLTVCPNFVQLKTSIVQCSYALAFAPEVCRVNDQIILCRSAWE